MDRIASVLVMALVVGFTAACASGLPAVLSSNPEMVAIEFSVDENVSSTAKLASKECEKYGLQSEFVEVQSTAGRESRVASYKCVKGMGQ